MNEFQQLYEQRGDCAEVVPSLQERLNLEFSGVGESRCPWLDLYWISKYLFEYDEDCSSDELIIRALEKAASCGMNVYNDKALYLDGTMMLAQKYLKYGDYLRAANCLMELRDNTELAPDWVHIYYAVAVTHSDLETVLVNPGFFLETLSSIDENDGESWEKR